MHIHFRITPAPITAGVFGRRPNSQNGVRVVDLEVSNGKMTGRTGEDPVAMRIHLAAQVDLRPIFGGASLVDVNLGTLDHFHNEHVEPGLDVPFVTKEIGDGRFLSEREIHAIKVTRPAARQRQSRLSECFTWRRTGVDTGAAEFVVAIDESHSLPEFSGGSRPGYSRRAATDHNQVIISFVHPDHL
jgi:hypothetical protein